MNPNWFQTFFEGLALDLWRGAVTPEQTAREAGFIQEARSTAPGIEWTHVDMRTLPWTRRFDAAYCWGNSFGYFHHDDCVRFLKSIASALKPGGRFILESGARGPEREVKPIHQWLHSAAEIHRMLRDAGLEPVAAFADLDGSPYLLGSPHLIALARRRD